MYARHLWFSLVIGLAILFGTPRDALARLVKLQPIEVTASSNATGARNACDGNTATVWNSGGAAPQWIRFDLGKPVAVGEIVLTPALTPSPAFVAYEIWGGPLADQLQLIYKNSASMRDGEAHSAFVPGSEKRAHGIRYVEVRVTYSASWVAWREIEFSRNVQYFGYFGDVYDRLGTGNLMDQTIANGANVVWLSSGNFAWYRDRIQEASSKGAQSIVHLSKFLVDYNYNLYSDWEWRLNTLKPYIDAGGVNSVVAISPFDRDALSRISSTTVDLVYRKLRTLHPTLKLLGIFSAADIVNGQNDYAMKKWYFSYIGLDCPNSPSDCGGNVSAGSALAVLETQLNVASRVMVFPWAHRNASSDTGLSGQAQNIAALNAWTDLVNGHPIVIGIFGSQWTSGTLIWDSSITVKGTTDLPAVKSRMLTMAKEFVRPEGNIIEPVEVRASSTYSTTIPYYAFDRDDNTTWNSGSFPPAWLMADFRNPTRIRAMELKINQAYGDSWHRVTAFTPTGNVMMTTFGGLISDSQVFRWEGVVDAYAVLVETLTSSSWVAWREIKFFY